MRTSRGVLLSVHVLAVRIRRVTLPQETFTCTCFGRVSCQAIIVGPSMEKEGLEWKKMKKGMISSMTTILIISVILSWRMLKVGKVKGKVKKRHVMSPLMILVGPLLMHGDAAKLK